MTERRFELLKSIVDNYIKTAEPVGSKFVAENSGLNVSAPTLRNEMRELEKDGFLVQPYTSAGRIPTEQGYQFYVEHMLEDKDISEFKNNFENITTEGRERIKDTAKLLAEHLNNTVIVAFNPDSVYYTGVSNLFNEPEFKGVYLPIDVSRMFDKCEEIVYNLLREIKQQQVSVLIGNENPLGSVCGSLAMKFGKNGLIITMGPMRMDYAKNYSALNFVNKNL
jgi:heat-inducible transcriptional repressor